MTPVYLNPATGGTYDRILNFTLCISCGDNPQENTWLCCYLGLPREIDLELALQVSMLDLSFVDSGECKVTFLSNRLGQSRMQW